MLLRFIHCVYPSNIVNEGSHGSIGYCSGEDNFFDMMENKVKYSYIESLEININYLLLICTYQSGSCDYVESYEFIKRWKPNLYFSSSFAYYMYIFITVSRCVYIFTLLT